MKLKQILPRVSVMRRSIGEKLDMIELEDKKTYDDSVTRQLIVNVGQERLFDPFRQISFAFDNDFYIACMI